MCDVDSKIDFDKHSHTKQIIGRFYHAIAPHRHCACFSATMCVGLIWSCECRTPLLTTY